MSFSCQHDRVTWFIAKLKHFWFSAEAVPDFGFVSYAGMHWWEGEVSFSYIGTAKIMEKIRAIVEIENGIYKVKY